MRNYLALIALFLVTTTQAQIILPAYQAIQYRRNTLPTLITSNICSITPISANCSSIVSNDGGTPVTVRGICWSTTTGPTIDLVTKTTDGSGIGSFLSSITGLTLGVTYFVRAYATNNVGTAYGNELVFTTISNTNLSSVQICNQIWTTMNLDVDTYTDCTPIPEVTDPTIWNSLTTGAWCYYNNDPANGLVYGKLYNWYAIMGIYDSASLNNPALRKKLAPFGWHIPSSSEWSILQTCLGGQLLAGDKMKEAGNLHWFPPSNGSNSSGFTALPGGYRMASNGASSIFGDLQSHAQFWCVESYIWTITYQLSFLTLSGGYPAVGGLSVRCVKD